MNVFSTFRLASSSTLCAALVACADTAGPASSTVVRTRAPQGYEKTITNYFAFRIRGPQKNAEISFDKPEPGGCPLDGHVASSRGWVVPVVYATRTGAPTGKETINITTKQYYFWFLGDTIAGITPRIELCPGPTLSEFAQPSAVAEVRLAATSPLPTKPDAQRGEGAKKTGTPSGKVRQVVKKVGNSRGKVEARLKK